MRCALCGKVFDFQGKVGRNDICPQCGGDLRCCKQCNFYEPHAYNECREVIAERVVDKERANFCDNFLAKDLPRKGVDRTQNAKDALEALFKK